MAHFKIITKQDGTFSVQRAGSTEAHGSFSTYGEACEAIGQANIADQVAVANVANY